MPNYCTNKLIVSGKPEEIEALCQVAAGTEMPLSLEVLVPEPEGLHDRKDTASGIEAMYDKSIPDDKLDWYSWRVRNWGTKWDLMFDCQNTCLSPKEGKMVFYFLTAWSPPNEGILSISKKFPNLSFEMLYVEEGMDFAGLSKWRRGILLEEKNLDPQEVSESGDLYGL